MGIHPMGVVAGDLRASGLTAAMPAIPGREASIDHAGRAVLRKGEAKYRAALGGGHLRLDLSVCAGIKRNTVVVRARGFSE